MKTNLFHPLSSDAFVINSSTNQYFRFETPAWDHDKCIKCGTCYLLCPDSAVLQDEQGNLFADEELCKGCGLCAYQCWTGCISMEVSSQRPPWLLK